MFKFCMLYFTAKNFLYTKNKKILWCQKNFTEEYDIFAFSAFSMTEFFYILLIVSFSSK
jgi:hypothetical protein